MAIIVTTSSAYWYFQILSDPKNVFIIPPLHVISFDTHGTVTVKGSYIADYHRHTGALGRIHILMLVALMDYNVK